MQEEVDRLSPKERTFFQTSGKSPRRPALKHYEGTSGQTCACPFFNPVTQECTIYPNRPLDCQLYPFVLTFGATRKRILLSLDTQCPFVQDAANQEALAGYGDYVRDYLEERSLVSSLSLNPGLVSEDGPSFLPFFPLAGLSEKICRVTLYGDLSPLPRGWNPVTLEDHEFLRRRFSGSPREFSEESFVSSVIFSDLMHFYWKEKEGVLFMVAQQGNRFFMSVPPLVPKRTDRHLRSAFEMLSELNPPGSAGRIEGLTEEEAALAASFGACCYPKPPEYLYERKSLVELSGDPYKSKRALCNYFTGHYPFTLEPYQSSDFLECLQCFKRWQNEKQKKTEDTYALALLEDAAFVHRRALLHAEALELEGKVIRIAGEVKGYTFGYPLKEDTWCILLEIADPSIKGLAQFLFREFCREKSGFEWISAMDDSGLESLRQVKRSYRPARIKTPFVASREGP